MCRLALMNAEAVALLDEDLSTFFLELELAQGGNGNGVAALWSETGQVRMRKGLTVSSWSAAGRAQIYVGEGADWILFHTRLATVGKKLSRNCHPFQHGELVLAHNGHAWNWADLGESIGVTDSECITLIWQRLNLPLAGLQEEDGVFIGFFCGAPFVIKGAAFDDLSIAVHAESGALLFASEIPSYIRRRFDRTIEVGRLHWFDQSLDLAKVERRYRRLTRPLERVSPLNRAAGFWDKREEEEEGKTGLELLREMYRRLEQEQGNEQAPVSHNVETE